MNQLAIEYLDVKRLKVSPHNARTHSETQIEQLANAIKQFGFTSPILIDEKRMVIAGHGRLAAAKQLEMARVPTITLKGLTPTRRRALMLADNRIALNAGWDQEALARELQELSAKELDLTELGFSDAELKNYLGTEGEPEAPEYRETFAIIIDCASEKQQTKLLERFDKEGLKCRALVS